MELDLLMRHSIGNVDVYTAESVEMLLDHWKAKYAAVVAELECAQNDIELRDREIAVLKAKNSKHINDKLTMADKYNESLNVRVCLQSEICDLKIENKLQSMEYITLAGELQTHLESIPKLKAEAIREAVKRNRDSFTEGGDKWLCRVDDLLEYAALLDQGK